MNQNTLGALLVAQIFIIAGFSVFDYFADQPPPPFLVFDKAAVATIRISENDRQLSLSKVPTAEASEASEALNLASENKPSAWTLSDGLSADGTKARSLIDKIFEAGKADWPVATTLISSDRFEVADENYRKRILFENAAGEPLVDLYLGTSPNFGQIHARLAFGLGIYSISFADYESVPEHKDWLQKTLLQAKGEVDLVRRLDGTVWALMRVENGWASNDIASLDIEEANAITNRLKHLRVLERTEPVDESTLMFRYYLEDAEGGYHLDFFDQGEDNNMVVKNDRLDAYFKASSHLRTALNISPANLASSDDS